MQKAASAEFREFNPSEHEDAGHGGRGESATSVARPPLDMSTRLLKKLQQLDGEHRWWAMVPRPFLCLIAFCFGFALLSLVGILLAAIFSSGDSGGATPTPTLTNGDDGASSAILLGIGVLSSVAGSLQTASGYCAQRLSHQIAAVAHRHAHPATPTPRTCPLFFIGLLLLVCGTIAAVVNLGILGQSVTAPFAAMTLIFNGCLAFTVLHEAVSKYDIIATVLVLFGVGVAMCGVGMASLDVQEFVLSDIEAIFVRSLFPTLYSAIVLSSLLAVYIFVMRRNLQSTPAGLCCFSVGAGVLSGFSSLCVKCTVEILKGAAQRHSGDLGSPITYVFVVGIPCCVLSQLKLMTLGLQHFGTLKFVPPYHAFIILSNLVNGMVYFDESKGYDALSAALFIVGCAVTVGGVFVLLAKVPQGTDNDGHSGSSATASSSDSDDAVLARGGPAGGSNCTADDHVV